MIRDPGLTLRIQWQEVLEAEDQVGHEHRHQLEDQHRDGVKNPALLFFRVDSEDPVSQPFKRFDHRIQEGFPVGVQDLEQVNTERFGDKNEGNKIEC